MWHVQSLVKNQNEIQSERERPKCLIAFSLHNFFCFWRQLELENYFLGRLEATFLSNFHSYNEKPLFRLVETSFF